MPNFKNIIVGIDFSKCSGNALREGMRVAGWNGADLHLLHVVDPRQIEALQDFQEIGTDEIVQRARDRLEELIAENPQHTGPVASNVVIGHPFEEILRAATQTPTCLLVLGAHGYEAKEGRTGTIAVKAVRKIAAPVLLVRKSQDHPFRKIVACTDFSENSIKAVQLGAKIALQDGASLEILHVHYPPWMHPTAVQYNLTVAPNADYRKQYLSLLQDKLDGLLEELSEEFPALEANTHLVERGHAGYAILEFLRESEADLAVMGTRGRTGLKILLLGTTAERVVNESPCSVLAVKPEEFKFPL